MAMLIDVYLGTTLTARTRDSMVEQSIVFEHELCLGLMLCVMQRGDNPIWI